jgi:hypothetical protein
MRHSLVRSEAEPEETAKHANHAKEEWIANAHFRVFGVFSG